MHKFRRKKRKKCLMYRRLFLTDLIRGPSFNSAHAGRSMIENERL